MRIRYSLSQAIEIANSLGFPYAVQDWGTNDYVVAHGAGDGVGKTVYATIRREER